MNLPQAKSLEESLGHKYRGLDSLRGCALAGEGNSIYCWRDLNRLQKDVAFCGVVFEGLILELLL